MKQMTLACAALLLMVSIGCGGKSDTAVTPTGVDTKAVQEYQQQSEGDAYKDYAEPK